MSHNESAASPEADGLPDFSETDSEAFSVRRVFGEAYEQGDALIIPVAVVAGTHGRALADGRGRLGDGRHRPFGAPEDHGKPEASDRHEHSAEAVTEQPAGSEEGPLPSGFAPDAPGPDRCAGPHHGPHPHGGRAHGMGRAGAGALAAYARPLGVYVVKDGAVSWRPAFDLNRAIIGGQLAGALVGAALAVAWPLATLLRRKR